MTSPKHTPEGPFPAWDRNEFVGKYIHRDDIMMFDGRVVVPESLAKAAPEMRERIEELEGALRTARRTLNRIVAEDPRGYFCHMATDCLEAIAPARCSNCGDRLNLAQGDDKQLCRGCRLDAEARAALSAADGEEASHE